MADPGKLNFPLKWPHVIGPDKLCQVVQHVSPLSFWGTQGSCKDILQLIEIYAIDLSRCAHFRKIRKVRGEPESDPIDSNLHQTLGDDKNAEKASFEKHV